MVDMVMDWLPAIKEKEPIKTWLEWVGTLRTVTEGKVRHVHRYYGVDN